MARKDRDRPVPQGGTFINGPVIQGGSGGIHVGRDMNVPNAPSVQMSVTQQQRRLVYKVLDAAEADVRWQRPPRAELLSELTEAADDTEPGALASLLERVVEYADPASAVLAAAQLALTVFGG